MLEEGGSVFSGDNYLDYAPGDGKSISLCSTSTTIEAPPLTAGVNFLHWEKPDTAFSATLPTRLLLFPSSNSFAISLPLSPSPPFIADLLLLSLRPPPFRSR